VPAKIAWEIHATFATHVFLFRRIPMDRARVAAVLYGLCAVVVVAFQGALAAGAPWGEYAMGGTAPGVWPPGLRVAAAAQALLNAWMAIIVLVRSGMLAPRWTPGAPRLIWLVVALTGVGTVLNVITPSRAERIRWAPVAVVLFMSSLFVARTARSATATR
jgi:hypothetical protein